MSSESRLIVVSDRLPITFTSSKDGSWSCHRLSSGLVPALEVVLRGRDGLWVGDPGPVEGAPDGWREMLASVAPRGYSLAPVPVAEPERSLAADGFTHAVLHPLFHDFQADCRFDARAWHAYRSVNRTMAEAVAERCGDDDLIWSHGPHLIPLASELNARGVSARKGFFLHLPFPAPDLFRRLPWRVELLDALLAHDLVGFQTRRDLTNFLGCIAELRPRLVTGSRDGLTILTATRGGTREARIGVFPIGVDAPALHRRAARLDVSASADRLVASLEPAQMILAVDHLDVAQGIPAKLRAFHHALVTYPELCERLTLVQLLAPCRDLRPAPDAGRVRDEIEHLVGQINGELATPGWVPVHYLNRDFTPEELLPYYRAADICLVTPLKDGMNLVAKEYCAASVDGRGTLVLSEFAGAADQLGQDALLVNPCDEDDVADQIYRAWTMSESEQNRRMQRMRSIVERESLDAWATSFVDDLRAAPRQGRRSSPLRHLTRTPARRAGSTRDATAQSVVSTPPRPPAVDLPRAG